MVTEQASVLSAARWLGSKHVRGKLMHAQGYGALAGVGHTILATRPQYHGAQF